MSTYFIPFFFPLRFSPKINSHPAHQLRVRNSLKLRFESGENRFPEIGFLGKTALCPAPEASGGRRGPAGPSRRPHLPRLRGQRPLPPSARLETRSHPRASRPRRPHPAHTSRRGRAACGPWRGARGRESRRGPQEAESTGASPRRAQARASPTYAVFLFLCGGPHGRAGRGPAGAAAGRQRGGDGRGPGCGAPRAEAGEVSRRGAVGGASLTGRPGCRRRRHVRTVRLRGRPGSPGRRG